MTIRPRVTVTDPQPETLHRRGTRRLRRVAVCALLVTALVSAVLTVAPSGPAEAAAPTPAIANPTVPQADVVLYTHDVADYGADPSGLSDNTAAFQLAIDQANAAGGGIVYAAAGLYKFTGHLVIKRGVTLRGEWQSPASDPHWKGTLLMPYADRGTDVGEPFIGLGSNAGVKNLSFWYPEQTAANVQKYPYTISDYREQGLYGTHAPTVQNVTLFNSYLGIDTGSIHSVQPGAARSVTSTEPRVRDVYGTFLSQGIITEWLGNFGATTNFYASSKYWIESGLAGAPTSEADRTALKTYMRNNLTAVATNGQVDGTSFYNINIEDAQLGILGTAYWQYFANIHMSNVRNGIRITGSNDVVTQNAQQIIDAHIATLPKQGEDNAAISIQTKGVVDIVGVEISGNATYGILGGPESRLSILQGEFSGWATAAGAAINASGTSLRVSDSKFNVAGLHVYLGPTISSAAALGNAWVGGRTIHNASPIVPTVDDTALNLPQTPDLASTYTTIPARKPSNAGQLFNITDYGAQPGNTFDNTLAISSALSAAANQGGGTVVVPAGRWRVAGSLTVPSGVQLRGVSESVGVMDNLGSTLLITGGKGNEAGTPAVTLSENSGFVGLKFWYPDVPMSNTQTKYPWSIRAAGPDVYIRNVGLGNAWRGIDLYSNRNDRFAVSGVWGDPSDIGISIGGGSVGGKIEDTLFSHAGSLADSESYAYPNQNWATRVRSDAEGPYDFSTTRAPLIFSNSVGTTGLQNYAYKPQAGAGQSHITFMDSGGVADDVTLVLSGSDVGNGFNAYAGGDIKLIGLATTWSGSVTQSTFAGTIDVFAYNVGSIDSFASTGALPGPYFLWNNGGTVNIVGGGGTYGANLGRFRLDGGSTTVAGFTLSNSGPLAVPRVEATSNIVAARVFGIGAYGAITSSGNAGSKLVIANNIQF